MKRFLQLRILLLAVTGGIFFWFFGQASMESWKCLRLDAKVSAENVKWEIKELNSSHYVLVAHYRYVVNGRALSGQTQFSTPFYLNYYAAQSELKVRQIKPSLVWYRERNPTFSSLDKRFPKKEFTYALLAAGVFFYFYLMRGLITVAEKVIPKM